MAAADFAVDGPLSFPKNTRPPVVTPCPSMWSDTFTSYSVNDQVQEKYGEEIQGMKEETRGMLMLKEKTMDKLILIDTLERLGVAYHFQQEIEEQLEHIFKHHADHESEAGDIDLFATALKFRLLRQHRYNIPCGVFEKFKDKEENKFEESLTNDVEGLLSLYEAAHLRIHGEDILEEAVVFTTNHLNVMLPQLESPLQDKIKRALEQPLHRGVPRIETRHYISIYEKDGSRNKLLVQLAKLDFNFLQSLYKKELCDLSRWWNDFELKSKLPYARDRFVECYFWGVAHHFEPQYSFVRSAIAKTMQLVSVMDDTYDNYATLEEAQLFTEILERWDIGEIDGLPDYMKIVYRFLLETYEGFEREASELERSFVVPYAIEAVKQLGRAYLKELKWFMGRQMPQFEEYFSNTVITSGIYVMFSAAFIGMKSAASIETMDWFVTGPRILVATAKLGRFVQDLSSHERENKEGKMLTAVDCYIQQHGSSEKETLSTFKEKAAQGWKDIDAERLDNVPMFLQKDFVDMFLNYARAAEVTYGKGVDGYTYPETFFRPMIASVLLHSIPFRPYI